MLEEELSINDEGSSILEEAFERTQLHVFPVWEWDDNVEAVERIGEVHRNGISQPPFGSRRWNANLTLPGSSPGSISSFEQEISRILASSRGPLAIGEFDVVDCGESDFPSYVVEELSPGSCDPDASVCCPGSPQSSIRVMSPMANYLTPVSPVLRCFARFGRPCCGDEQVCLPARTLSRNSAISEVYASTVLTSVGSICGGSCSIRDSDCDCVEIREPSPVASRSRNITFDTLSNGTTDTILTGPGYSASIESDDDVQIGLARAISPRSTGNLASPVPFDGSGIGSVYSPSQSGWLSRGNLSLDPLADDDGEVSVGPESPITVSIFAANESEPPSSPEFDEALRFDIGQWISPEHSRQHLSIDESRRLPRVRFEAPERQSCSICLEVFGQGMLLTGLHCGHVFHVDCLSQWVQRAAHCPNCRAAVQPCNGPPTSSL